MKKIIFTSVLCAMSSIVSISGQAINMKIYGVGNSLSGYGDFGTALYIVQEQITMLQY